MKPARRTWLLVAGTPPLAAVAVTLAAPDPSGHWSEHLASAALKVAQLVVLVGLVAGLRRRLPLALTSVVVVVVVGIALQSLGDREVAESIWRTPGDPGFGAGYEAGHQLSGRGDLIVLAGGVAFAVVAAVLGRLRPGAAVGVAALAVVPPPFLWPGVGVAAVLLHERVEGAGAQRRSRWSARRSARARAFGPATGAVAGERMSARSWPTPFGPAPRTGRNRCEARKDPVPFCADL